MNQLSKNIPLNVLITFKFFYKNECGSLFIISFYAVLIFYPKCKSFSIIGQLKFLNIYINQSLKICKNFGLTRQWKNGHNVTLLEIYLTIIFGEEIGIFVIENKEIKESLP